MTNAEQQTKTVGVVEVAGGRHVALHRRRVFLEFSVSEVHRGRVDLELFNDLAPKTCANFMAICEGTHKGSSGRPLHYKGTRVHRIKPGHQFEMGDVVSQDGRGGESIYGPTFPTENLAIPHQGEGDLYLIPAKWMNTAHSQFGIALANRGPRWDGKCVVFGRVVDGLQLLRQLMEEASAQHPKLLDMRICNCGVLPL